MDMTTTKLKREPAAQDNAPTLIPAVDVFEDESGITVKADLPGVSKENLAIRVDGDTLVLEGRLKLGENEHLGNVYAEIRHASFKRSFVLSRDLDTAKIDASVKNGVVTLTIPKAEQAKPRRIEVRAE
jgi:HSP20 family molecular chaperone IbpA